MDASVPLVDEFELEIQQADSSSMGVTINVSYQWRPPACLVCQVFGHDTASCQPSTLNSTSQPLVSAENPAQTLELTKPSEQTGQAED